MNYEEQYYFTLYKFLELQIRDRVLNQNQNPKERKKI